jgi:surface antigen
MSRSTARFLAPVVLLAFLSASCAGTMQTIEDNPKALLGGAAGAAGGGLIAAAAGGGTAGIIGGVLLGGLLGGAIGNALDQRDKQLAQQAAQQAFEQNRTGASSTWQNPDSGHSGTITPTRTYQSGSGEYCREYQQTIIVGGEPQKSYGTACRQADGTWEIQ